MTLLIRYAYRAIDPAGRKVTGHLEAANPEELESRLRRLKLSLVLARPSNEKSRWPGTLRRPFSLRGLRRERIHFVFQLEQLLRAGVPILDALGDLAANAGNPDWRDVLSALYQSVSGGKTLSQSFNGFPRIFDPVFTSLIAAGEMSGQLPEILHRLHETLCWEDELLRGTARLVFYPLLIACFIAAAAAFLLIYLVPELKAFIHLTGSTLPFHSRLLFALSDCLAAHHTGLLIALGLCAVAGKLLMRILQRRDRTALFLDRARLRLPLIGKITKKIILARFAHTFSLLYSSGIPVVDAIRTLRAMAGNRAVAVAFDGVLARIMEGSHLSRAFAHDSFFPPLLLRMLQTGEQTGTLDGALSRIGYFYQRDVKEATVYAQTLIEPLLTLVLGLFLAWVMLSVLGPVYDILTNVRF